MEIINFSEQNSIINQYLAEIRDKDYPEEQTALSQQCYAYWRV